MCAVKPTIRDKSSWHTCLKRVLLSTISYICYFILFKHRKSPHPRINVVCSKRKTWGSKTQHWFRGEGVGVHRGRGQVCPLFKKGPFIEVSQHVCPSLQLGLLYTSIMPNGGLTFWSFFPCRTDGLDAVNKLNEGNIVLDLTILTVKQTGDKIFAWAKDRFITN